MITLEEKSNTNLTTEDSLSVLQKSQNKIKAMQLNKLLKILKKPY